MKKFFKTAAAALCIAVTATSCGTMLLNNSNSGTNLTNVELSHANYRVVKNVEGFASASYVFGIGGLSQKATRDNAVADMTRKADLKGSQALVNVHIKSHVATVLGIYTRFSCAATAQVIEFLPETNIRPTDIPIETDSAPTTTAQYRNIGDIYDDSTIRGYVFAITDDGQHGRIVYPKIVDRTQWCVQEQEYLPATTDEYDGEANMRIIRREANWQDRFPAFAACAQLGEQWYLPAKHELELLHEVLVHNRIIDLQASDAWSSTVNNTSRKTIKTYLWNNSRAKDKNYIIAVAKF